MAKPLPTHADLIACNHAVAGHDGTLCDVDGELFIKPCVQAEIDFYTSSNAYHPEFAEFMPTYLGTLSLGEQTNGASIEELGAKLVADLQAQNGTTATEGQNGNGNGTTIHNNIEGAGHLTNGNSIQAIEPHHHTLPNGTSHEDDINYPISRHTIPEVIVPMKASKKIVTDQAIVLENAASSFIKPNILDVKLGVRLWAADAAVEKQIRFDKVTKETTHKELGFRIAGMRVWQGKGAKGIDVDEEGYKIYDKNYGRFSLNKHNVHEAFRNFIFEENAGIDQELGQLVAEAFATDVRRIQEVLENQESRMFSASLLFVFEGDGEALRSAMEETSKPPPRKTTNGITNGNGNGHMEEEDDEDEEEETKEPKIYVVKVIDFAHAEWVPGLGPDENSLLGVRSVARILENLGSGKI